VDVSALFYGVKTHGIKNIRGKRKFSVMEVYLSGTQDQNGELSVVASNMGDAEQLVLNLWHAFGTCVWE